MVRRSELGVRVLVNHVLIEAKHYWSGLVCSDGETASVPCFSPLITWPNQIFLIFSHGNFSPRKTLTVPQPKVV